jgi:hypothetical protein
MLTGNTPDITPAQIVAVIGSIVTEALGAALISGRVAHLVVGLAGILVPFAWIVADAIIRHGRSRALTPTASATVQVTPTDQVPPVASA